ncbi:protein translocase subunit SecF [Agaribacterium sp. ZY112]|uniref:protein translocase subunit SecF n=1 Tax=Agaribacterium sp. ZY112 TaxID=3233574 RepID=UPI0035249765
MSEQKVIRFMRQRYVAAALSIALIIASITGFAMNGMSLGLDFTGGALVELKYETTADLNSIRDEISDLGYPSASVIYFGSDRDVQIRFQTDNPQKGGEVADAFVESSTVPVELQRISYVGPQIGEELTNDGGLGMLLSLVIVMAYVALRFQAKFSVGAVAALIHDVIIVLGVFAIFQLDFDLTVLAAVLAVIGYSLNDTIVVADRIRENFRIVRNKTSVEVVDISLTQTLERTLITSLTTLLVLLALFFVGGEMIHNFALALIIGVVVGTYSSIYVAANVLLGLNISREDLIPVEVEKEGEELEELP